MMKYEERFSELERQVTFLLKTKKRLEKEVEEKQSEIESLLKERVLLRNKNQTLEDINNKLKIANALQGNTEHRRLMKLKINQLIKEIDLCMAAVKRVSL